MTARRWVHVAVALLLLLAIAFAGRSPMLATDRTVGIASHYGPGTGVATQWCTWVLRHSRGCGVLAVQSHDTGLVVIAPIVDWCQCYRGTADERIVDLQWDVVAALGLDRSAGLYHVTTWPVDGLTGQAMPDTAMRP